MTSNNKGVTIQEMGSQGLHVEEDGVGNHGGEKVGKDEVGARRVADQAQGHDGPPDARLDEQEDGEADGEDGEGRDDEGVRPCEVSVERHDGAGEYDRTKAWRDKAGNLVGR